MLEMPLELTLIHTDDFLDMGKDLMNPKLGSRYFKYSDNRKEHGFLGSDYYYIGEWSTNTKKPHGRGISINIFG